MRGTIIGCLFITVILAVVLLGGFFFVKMAMEPLPTITAQQPAAQPQVEPIVPVTPGPVFQIIRIPQTVGLAPGMSGVTPETPYNATLPMKLSVLPSVSGYWCGDNVTWRLQDIIEANKGKDIVISLGDTWCGACLGVIKTFGDFEANYGNLVTFIAVMENAPDRMNREIAKYALNPDVIFLSDIENLDEYHQAVLQGFMYRPICLHINPEGKVDRILISSFGSVENLQKFIGIEIKQLKEG